MRCNSRIPKFWRLFICAVALNFAWTSIAVSAEAAKDAAADVARDADWHRTRDDLAKNLRLLKASRGALDVSGIDPAAAAKEVGPDVGALFAFVRDGIGFQPYRGIQRLAAGTLMSGAGNSCDKSLLLGAMLRAEGFSVRYARATLDEQAAWSRLAEVDPLPRPAQAATPLLSREPGLDRLLLSLGASPDDVAADVKAGVQWQQALISGLGWGVQRNYDLLNAKLQEAGLSVGKLPNPDVLRLMDNVRDHCWVEVQKDGAWVDLDPSLHANAVGQRPAEPASVGEGLPPTLAPQLKLTMRVAQKTGVTTAEQAVLESEVTLDAAVSEMQLVVLPEPWLGKITAAADQTPTPDDLNVFVPILSSNGEKVVGQPFDLSGKVLAQDEALRMAGSQGASAAGALDKLGQALSGDSGAPAPQLSAVVLDFELKQPDGRVQTWHRTLAQRGDDANAFLSDILAPMSLVATAAHVDQRFADVRRIDGFLANRQMLVAGADASFGHAPPNVEQVAEETQAVPPSPLLDLLVLRGKLIDHLSALHATGVLAYSDGPFIAAWRQRTDPLPEPHLVGGIDIMANGVTAIDFRPAGVGGDRTAAFRLAAGVTDTLLEYLLVGGGEALNAHSAIYAADVQSIPLTVLKPGGAAPAGFDPGTARLLGEELAAGYAVVVPSHTVPLAGHEQVAWWRIDPATGATLGIAPDGAGAAMTDYAILVGKHVGMATLMCVAGHFAFGLFGASGPLTVKGLSLCVAVSLALAGAQFGLGRAFAWVVGGGALGAAAGGRGVEAEPPAASATPKGGGKVASAGPQIEPALPAPAPSVPARGRGGGASGGGGGGGVAAEPVNTTPYDPIEPPGPPGSRPGAPPKQPFNPRKGGLWDALTPRDEPTPGSKTEKYEQPPYGKTEKNAQPSPTPPRKTTAPGYDGIMSDTEIATARKAEAGATSWNAKPPLTSTEVRTATEVHALQGLDSDAIEAGLAWTNRGRGVSVEDVMRSSGQTKEQVAESLTRFIRGSYKESDPAKISRIVDAWMNGGGGAASPTPPQPPDPARPPAAGAYDPFSGARAGATTINLPLGE